MPELSTPAARRPGRAPLGWPRVALVLLLLPLLLAGSARAGDTPGIAWRADLATAQAEARARNLPLWVQFTGPWCLYCRMMDQNAFLEPGIIARSQAQFVPVKLRSDEHEDLVAQLDVTSLPSAIFLSPSGALLLGRTGGYSDPETFASVLDGAWANALAAPEILALSGYCPVRLVQGQGRIAGDPTLAVFHDGHAYRFADADARAQFLRDPERFLPGDGGRCVVSRQDKNLEAPGDPRFGATYRGRLYVFANAEAQARFAADPDKYSRVDLADNGLCPHCRLAQGKQVAGKPEFAATHSGRRYLFPDDAHRQAFRDAPERYLR